jgi:hypothetical protein
MQMNAKPKPGKIDIGGQILGCNSCPYLIVLNLKVKLALAF